MKLNGKIVQTHHVFYATKKEGNKRNSQREILLPLYMHEHRIVSLIQRLKPENISSEFWQSLRVLDAAYSPFAKSIREQMGEP